MSRVHLTLLAAVFAITACDRAGEAQAGDDADCTEEEGAHAELPAASGGGSGDGSRFGGDFTLAEAKPLGAVLADPEPFVDQTVRVAGTVVDVCEKRGCWLTLGADNGEVLRIKVRDGEMVFPMSARGLKAEVEGTLTARTISVEDQIKRGQHFAEESGETFDPASVTGPKTLYMLAPTSVVIAS